MRYFANRYLQGLLSRCRRKSIQPLAEQLALEHAQNLHHFVRVASWDTEPLETLLAQQAQNQVGGEDSALIVDDMSLLKAGCHSVRVARQYSGKVGKRENCQVLVSLTLAKREVPIPVALRLFLPQEWISDQHRCDAAGVPQQWREERSKGMIALAGIDRVLAAGVEPGV